MSIHNLPCEMLRSIFEKVGCQDIPQLRSVCHMFNEVVKRNYIFLPRIAHVCRVYMENGQIYITHKKSGSMNGCTQNINEFDWAYWKEIEIVGFEFNNIETMTGADVAEVLEAITNNFWKTRQAHLRKVRFSFVNLDESCSSQIAELFEVVLRSCEDVIVDNCSIPVSIDNQLVMASSFDHFRWISSNSTTELPTDAILHKIQLDMKKAVNKRSFLVEMDSVKVESVCDFIQEWLHLPIASFFNLSFHNCDEMWKTRFLIECEKKKLTNNYMEFQSETHKNAHIKVSFSQDSKSCCLWPIFDVPARVTGQSFCYARYFRESYR